MNTFKKILMYGIVVLFLTQCTPTAPAKKKSTPLPQKKWTFMMYLDGDQNEMQSDFLTMFEKLITYGVGSNDHVNIIVQFDRIPGGLKTYGGWTICHRFYYTPKMEPTEQNAIADWGDGTGGREVDMTAPETLTNFVNWATENYPAEHYALVLADHGFGWKGLFVDVTNSGNEMLIKQIGEALDAVAEHIDLLAFDACLMQTIEVAYQIRNCGVGLMVGSENPGEAWPLWDTIAALVKNPDMVPVGLGKTIIDNYISYHSDKPGVTLSMLNLPDVQKLTDAFVDLNESLMAKDDPVSQIKANAQKVMKLVDEAILYQRYGSEWDPIGIGGLSICFPMYHVQHEPCHPRDMVKSFYLEEIIDFAGESLWRKCMMRCFDGPMTPGPFPISPLIYSARSKMKNFDQSNNIDLYAFCKQLTLSQ